MIVTIAAVISVDGKLTKHDETDVSKWASKEDQKHFSDLRAQSDAILMGSVVYEASRDSLSHETSKLRVVLTSHPEKYQSRAVAGKLEFYNQEVTELLPSLEARGFENLLVAGGPRIISDILGNDLADYLYITIEPMFFGQGVPITEGILNTQLELVSSQQMNLAGTMLLKYKVV